MTSRILALRDALDDQLPESYRWSSTNVHFLALALCGEAGELANFIKKEWRDGVDHTEAIRDEIADVRVYLELLARCFGIEGSKLDDQVESKFIRVIERLKVTKA
jgi:NTP pyrophosphatase (non-canonical NTP hydrolase)